MLKVEKFSKKYSGAQKFSAIDISFEVNDGEIMGLVGSNGAGKSTTIKSITGILPFEKGRIIVNGFDIKENSIAAKQSIGYVPDNHAVYEKLTGREYVSYMGSLFGVSKKLKKERIDFYSQMFSITAALDNQISSYSHGMKQKICIIGSLIHNPKLWILDEPMTGLDPQTTNEVKKCIVDYANMGNTVLFSSHNLDVVQRLCDKAGVIKDGRLIALLDMHEMNQNPYFDMEKYYMDLIGQK